MSGVTAAVYTVIICSVPASGQTSRASWCTDWLNVALHSVSVRLTLSDSCGSSLRHCSSRALLSSCRPSVCIYGNGSRRCWFVSSRIENDIPLSEPWRSRRLRGNVFIWIWWKSCNNQSLSSRHCDIVCTPLDGRYGERLEEDEYHVTGCSSSKDSLIIERFEECITTLQSRLVLIVTNFCCCIEIKEPSEPFLGQDIVRYYPRLDTRSNRILRKISCNFLGMNNFFLQHLFKTVSRAIPYHHLQDQKDILNVLNSLTVYRTTRRERTASHNGRLLEVRRCLRSGKCWEPSWRG